MADPKDSRFWTTASLFGVKVFLQNKIEETKLQ
jgi:hypothetical protein